MKRIRRMISAAAAVTALLLFMMPVCGAAAFDGALPDLTIDKNNYSCTLYGTPLALPPKELELLYFLASSPNQVFTRDQLLDRVWGYDYVGDSRTVDVHIKRLREKLGDHDAWSLHTVWGVGYRFEVR